MSILKIYGKNPSKEKQKRFESSPQFRGQTFYNLSPTRPIAKDSSFLKTTKEFFTKPKTTEPSSPLPFVTTDLKALSSAAPTIVWFGHSSYLIRIHGLNILVDPVLSGHASPFSFMLKAFEGSDYYKPHHIPEIDLLILTHDHYDHLDYNTLMALKSRTGHVVCPLGVGSHLEYWGFDEATITELDWWQDFVFNEQVKLTATPARHYTGRGLIRSRMLWSSFVLEGEGHRLYLGGDSGYDRHFKQIGEKFGSFDIALLEAGQYNTSWPHIHMMPEETVQASVDLNANVLFPVHWAKFALAMHSWNEPIGRVLKKASELNVNVVAPKIGEPLVLDTDHVLNRWWE